MKTTKTVRKTVTPAAAKGFQRLIVYPDIWDEAPGRTIVGHMIELDAVEHGDLPELVPAIVMKLTEDAHVLRHGGQRLTMKPEPGGPGGVVRVIASPALLRLRHLWEDQETCALASIRCVQRGSFVVDVAEDREQRDKVDPKAIIALRIAAVSR